MGPDRTSPQTCPPPTALGRRCRLFGRELHFHDLEDPVLETALPGLRTPEIDSGLGAGDAWIFGIAQHGEVGDRARTIVDRRPDGIGPVDQICGGANHDGGMAGCPVFRSPEVNVEGSIVEDDPDAGALKEWGECSPSDGQIGRDARAGVIPWVRR